MTSSSRHPAYQLPSGFELWRLGVKAAELWVSAAATMTMRGDLWLTTSPSSPKLLSEWNRMVSEKAAASMATAFELQKIAFSYGTGSFNAASSGSRLLKPWHSRTMSNSRRLSKRRR